MSRLYASITSDARKTEPTARGHSSMSTHIRGWEVGVKVEVKALDNGRLRFHIYRTRGSNPNSSMEELIEVIEQ